MSSVSQLLHYGYLPEDTSGLPPTVESSTRDNSVATREEKLLKDGSGAFNEAIASCLETLPDDVTHVIPLSSGLDSRFILGAICERIPRESILTITYGTPGAWDFELGQQVAHRAGVGNVAVDLRYDVDWSPESIDKSASCATAPSRLLALHANQRLPTFIDGEEWVLWSGFLGEASAGQHLPEDEAGTWADACEAFAAWSQWTSLAPEDYEPTESLPDEPFIERDRLRYRDQLDFAVRQEMFIRPIVGQFDTVTPFATTEWLKFALNIPKEYRQNRSLFKKLAAKKYPTLFEIGSDATFGQPLNAGTVRRETAHYFHGIMSRISNRFDIEYTHPNIQYLDFDSAFRNLAPLRDSALWYCDRFDSLEIFDTDIGLEMMHKHQAGQDCSKELRAIMTASAFA